jgi:hypothetical protein
MQNQIVIDDPIIVSYFKENTHIDIIKMNHILIDILKHVSTNTNTNTNTNITNTLNELNMNITSMKLDFIMKLFDMKKEYIEDIKNMFITNSLKNNEKFTSIIEKNNDNMISKLSLLINDVIEKSLDKNVIMLDSNIKNYFLNMSNELNNITLKDNSNNTFNNIDSLICRTIEGQFIRMTTTVQQPILSSISNSLNVIKENFNHQKIISSDIYNLLNTEKNSKYNNESYHIIQSIMPTDEIIKISDTCFKVNRQNKQKSSIIFEIKDYSESVTTDEVNDFEMTTKTQKIHGIMISQQSPITYKNSYQIDINNQIINVYVINAEYNIDKIKIAVDIIDNLNSVFFILENKVTKENIEMDNGLLCTFCNNWHGKNKSSLSAHIRNCKSNPKNL